MAAVAVAPAVLEDRVARLAVLAVQVVREVRSVRALPGGRVAPAGRAVAEVKAVQVGVRVVVHSDRVRRSRSNP